MKRNILSVIGILAAVFVQAAPINSRKAAENVREFLFSSSRNIKMASPTDITMVGGDEQPYYIFNIGEDNGFVIASGDDAAATILGYSNRGHYDAENVPEVVKAWLDAYARDIRLLQKQSTHKRNNVYAVSGTRENIPAKLSTHWSSGYPYNNMCPDFNDGKGTRRVTSGIVAMAQLMRYHQYPSYETSGFPEYSYVDEEQYGGDGSTRVMPALNPVSFKWDLMPGHATNDMSQESVDAVAELFQHCAYGLQTWFLGSFTYSFNEYMQQSLVEDFGYKNTVRYVNRSDYATQEEWEDIIYNELYENRPVIYTAQQESGGMQTFVCDGYDSGFFHMNWGWGGNYDGYFKFTALDPLGNIVDGEGSDMSLTSNHVALIGIEKGCGADGLYVQCTQARVCEFIETEICLSNTKSNYTSLQFDLHLPEGIDITADEAGQAIIEFVNTRSENNDHAVSVNKLSDGSYRVLVLSNTNSRITENVGPLLKLKLSTNPDMKAGEYSIRISNIKLCDTDMMVSNLKDYETKIYLLEKIVIYGDADNNRKVDEADVKFIADYILNGSTGVIEEEAADVDKDGFIDVNDLMLTLDIVLQASGSERNILETYISPSDKLWFGYRENGLIANLSNSGDYKALQMDILLPEGTEIKELKAAAERIEGFNVMFKNIEANKYRVLLYSSASENIKPVTSETVTYKYGKLFDIITNKNLEEAKITNVIMSSSDLHKNKIYDDYDFRFVLGDADNNGWIDGGDTSAIYEYIVNGNKGNIQTTLADFDKDGTIDVNDLTLVNDVLMQLCGANRYIEETEINPEDRLYLSYSEDGLDLNLTNTTGYKALQMDITLPEGVSIKEITENIDRIFEFGLKYGLIEGNTYRVLLYPYNNQNIEFNEGALVHIVTDKLVEDASITGIILSTSDLRKAELKDTSYNVPRGDANNDGRIEEADVLMIRDYINGAAGENINKILADVNNDDKIDLADLELTIDAMLKESGADRNIIDTEINAADAMTMEYDNGRLVLGLTNTTGYKAMQMDVYLGAEIELNEVKLSDKRLAGFEVVSTKISDNKYRIMFYSMKGACIEMNEGELMELVTTKEVEKAVIDNVTAVTSDLRGTSLSDVNYVNTGIEDVMLTGDDVSVYTLGGVRVDSAAGRLPAGIYVVNGKKTVIK